MTREEAISFFKDMNECTYGNLEAVEMAIKALEQETQYENYIKKSEVVISQLRADIDRLLKAFDDMKSEIEKLQTYKMFIGEEETYVERDDMLAIIDKYIVESEPNGKDE